MNTVDIEKLARECAAGIITTEAAYGITVDDAAQRIQSAIQQAVEQVQGIQYIIGLRIDGSDEEGFHQPYAEILSQHKSEDDALAHRNGHTDWDYLYIQSGPIPTPSDTEDTNGQG